MGGLQAGSDWDAYTDEQWESWNGWQLGYAVMYRWNVIQNKKWSDGHQLDTDKRMTMRTILRDA